MQTDVGTARVEGLQMQRLKLYLETYDAEEMQRHLDEWAAARVAFLADRDDFELARSRFRKAFGDTSSTAEQGERAFNQSADEMDEKAALLGRASDALADARGTLLRAQAAYENARAGLPPTHGAPPDPKDARYATTSVGGHPDNAQRLIAAEAAWAAEESAIADAETQAAEQCELILTAIRHADPEVRNVTGTTYTPPPASESDYRGGASVIAAAEAKIARTSSCTLYPEGMGHEIIAAERAVIKEEQAANVPEWDDPGGRWVNHDGSPAPAAAYAGVIDSDGGFSPLVAGGDALAGIAVTAGAAKVLSERMAVSRTALTTAGSLAGSTAGQGDVTAQRIALAEARAGTYDGDRADGVPSGAPTSPDDLEKSAAQTPDAGAFAAAGGIVGAAGIAAAVIAATGRGGKAGGKAGGLPDRGHASAGGTSDVDVALDVLSSALSSDPTAELHEAQPKTEAEGRAAFDPAESMRMRGVVPDLVTDNGAYARSSRNPARKSHKRRQDESERKNRQDRRPGADEDDEWADLKDEPPRR